MRTFKKIFQNFKLEHSADARDMQALFSFAALSLPQDYIELLKFSNGLCGWFAKRYLIIYSANEVITINRAAATADYCPGRLIFGSNGGGTSYLLELGQLLTSRVYRCEDVELGIEHSILIASSIDEFLLGYGPEAPNRHNGSAACETNLT